MHGKLVIIKRERKIIEQHVFFLLIDFAVFSELNLSYFGSDDFCLMLSNATLISVRF